MSRSSPRIPTDEKLTKAELIEELAHARRRIAELEAEGGSASIAHGSPISSGQLADALFDNAASVLYLKDTLSRILRINRHYEEFFGISNRDAIGKTAEAWLPPDFCAALLAQDQEVLRTAAPVVQELDYRAPDGMTHTIMSTKFPVFDNDRTVVAIGGINTDITDRKRVEAALAESEARYRDLIEGSLQCIFVVSSDWKPLFVNSRGAKIFGYDSPEEILALDSMLNLFAPEERVRLSGYKNARLAGKPIPEVLEYQGVRKDGSRIWLINQSRAITWAGQPAIQATAFDITDFKMAEDALQHAAKMEALGQLTGGIAHDFNNMLSVIQGNLELLQELSADQPEFATLIRPALEATVRGGRLTHRLLAFASRRELNPRPTDVNALVMGMSDLLSRTLGEGIGFRTRIDAECGTVSTDPEGLESALLHLALNARDAMPDGGTVTIETAASAQMPDNLDTAVRGKCVVLSVADTGHGMPLDRLGQAFVPFYTTKDMAQGGVGLGLSVVYGFARQTGGAVEIDSGPGAGTTVRLYLPVSIAVMRSEDVGHDPNSGETAGSRTVLVVEDDPELRQLTVHMLKSMGYATLEAGDGPAALDLLDRTEGVDLLFSDVVLPHGMSGARLAREALKRRPMIRVLLTSGYALSISETDLDDTAQFEIIDKPYHKSELVERLRKIFAKPSSD